MLLCIVPWVETLWQRSVTVREVQTLGKPALQIWLRLSGLQLPL